MRNCGRSILVRDEYPKQRARHRMNILSPTHLHVDLDQHGME